jgi:hypothetical protein
VFEQALGIGDDASISLSVRLIPLGSMPEMDVVLDRARPSAGSEEVRSFLIARMDELTRLPLS